MRFCCFFLLSAASGFYPQALPAQQLASPAIPPADRVIATVNGENFTQQDFDRLLASMTPEVRQEALKQPKEVLEQYATFQVLLADAEKNKLGDKSPYREQIVESRRQVLIQAQISELSKGPEVSPEVLRREYEANKSRYTEAKVKVLFISSFSNDKTLDGKDLGKRDAVESKKLAEDVFAKLKGGAEFVKLAREYSDDGGTADTGADYPDTITSTSAGMPQQMRDAILAAETGDLLGPFEHQTGFYIFRVQSLKRKPFEEASAAMVSQVGSSRVQERLAQARKRAVVVLSTPEVKGN